jgi:hypothetical protein
MSLYAGSLSGVLSPVPDPAGSVAGGIVSAGIGSVMDSFTQWVDATAVWVLDRVGGAITSTTAPHLGDPFFAIHYRTVALLAAMVAAPLLFVSALQAVVRQDASLLLRCALVNLPLALLAAGVAVQVVKLAVGAVDAMCTAVTGTTHSDLGQLFSQMEKWFLLGGNAGAPGAPSFLLFLLGAVVVFGGLALWAEMALRTAAIYVVVLFLPLAMIGTTLPATVPWCKRLIETLVALVVSKLVIVAALSLAVSMAGSPSAGFEGVVEGTALMLVSTFVPFALLKLVPLVEAGAIHHLEGVARRQMAAPVAATQSMVNTAGSVVNVSGSLLSLVSAGGVREMVQLQPGARHLHGTFSLGGGSAPVASGAHWGSVPLAAGNGGDQELERRLSGDFK